MGPRIAVDELVLKELARDILYVFRRIAPSYFAGRHFALREHASTEWAGVREKKPGEVVPPRHIHRRLSRRFGGARIYRNVYESLEREHVTILVDVSLSSTDSAREEIFLRLLQAVSIFAYAAVENHDIVRAIAFNESSLVLYEKQELVDMRHFLTKIAGLPFGGFKEKSLRRHGNKSTFEQAALLAISQRKHGGTIILISDFLPCVDETWMSRLTRLGRSATLIPIMVCNREEERMVRSRFRYVPAIDPETGHLFSMNFFGSRGRKRRERITETHADIARRLEKCTHRKPFVFDERQTIPALIRYCLEQKRKAR